MKIKFLGESELEGEVIGNFAILSGDEKVFHFSTQIKDKDKLKETLNMYLTSEKKKAANREMVENVITDVENQISSEQKYD